MPSIRIRIDGHTDSASRLRMKRELERAGSTGSAASGGAVASGVSAKALLVVMAVAGVVYSNSNGSKSAVLLDGKEFRADRVVVLRDVSPSMSNLQGRLQSRLAELRAAGVAIDLVADAGGASVDDAVTTLRRVLPDLPLVDTVYFFSDFQDRSDADGYNQLRELLGSRGLRFYIATVNLEPAQEWVELARQSGGDSLVSRR